MYSAARRRKRWSCAVMSLCTGRGGRFSHKLTGLLSAHSIRIGNAAYKRAPMGEDTR